jgi:hypothetical protein
MEVYLKAVDACATLLLLGAACAGLVQRGLLLETEWEDGGAHKKGSLFREFDCVAGALCIVFNRLVCNVQSARAGGRTGSIKA